MAERCPRCGEELKFGKTPALKVCHDCPTCGGRLVTLPILKDGLGDKGVALLTRSVRTMAADGCVCPSCGKRMAILKVEVDGRKIEIDVCATCLSVWCDYGEFEALVPARAPKLGEMSMRELVSRASPEAQAHLQEALIESIPTEGVDFCDYNLNDVLLDVVRLLAGAPSLWQKIRLATPIFTLLLTLAIPVMQGVFCYDSSPHYKYLGRRDFWVVSDKVAGSIGFSITNLFSYFTFPFLQISGWTAIMTALLLFPVFSTVEIRKGHAAFLRLFIVLYASAIAAQIVALSLGVTHGLMCGIVPIAFGYMAFILSAFPELNMRCAVGGQAVPIGLYVGFVGFCIGMWYIFGQLVHEYLSAGFVPMLVLSVIGYIQGRRSRSYKSF